MYRCWIGCRTVWSGPSTRRDSARKLKRNRRRKEVRLVFEHTWSYFTSISLLILPLLLSLCDFPQLNILRLTGMSLCWWRLSRSEKMKLVRVCVCVCHVCMQYTIDSCSHCIVRYSVGYLPPPIRPTQLAQRLLQQQKYERIADEGICKALFAHVCLSSFRRCTCMVYYVHVTWSPVFVGVPAVHINNTCTQPFLSLSHTHIQEGRWKRLRWKLRNQLKKKKRSEFTESHSYLTYSSSLSFRRRSLLPPNLLPLPHPLYRHSLPLYRSGGEGSAAWTLYIAS